MQLLLLLLLLLLLQAHADLSSTQKAASTLEATSRAM
jgi:hypothetical protein